MTRPLLLSFGELLWDRFPDTRRAGGSPFNVAVHARHLGLDARLLSAVGQDALGGELLEIAERTGLPITDVARTGLPTGVVDITFDADGEPAYTIAEGVAWDQIPCGERMLEVAGGAAGFVFASLAQRTESNRRSLDRLRLALPPGCKMVFDLNLRPPFVERSRILELMEGAHVVKCNRDEWSMVRRWHALTGGDEEAAGRLMERTGIGAMLLTMGGDGAMVVTSGGEVIRQPVVPWRRPTDEAVTDGAEEGDLVGVGDAFLATVVARRILGASWSDALAGGALYAGWVAARRGATPTPDVALVERITGMGNPARPDAGAGGA